MENDNLELAVVQMEDLLSKFYQLRIQQIMLSFNLAEMTKTMKDLNDIMNQQAQTRTALT